MADSNNARQKKVKVEDLLRLKRAEKPNEAFWGDFDRELHQRMLRTLFVRSLVYSTSPWCLPPDRATGAVALQLWSWP